MLLGLMPWYERETRIKLLRFTMPGLFNIAHFQNQRKTVVLCAPRAGPQSENDSSGMTLD
jgi:hypothetical protein